jgi:hypothetical protein
VTFDFYCYRFTFTARDAIDFPVQVPGNMIRGALGNALRKIACAPECPGVHGHNLRDCPHCANCVYARLFEPAASQPGPSGLRNWPRPFVLRVSHLGGSRACAGQRFWLDVNLFDTRHPLMEHFRRAFEELAGEGLGSARSRAELVSVDQLDRQGAVASGPPISIPLTGGPSTIRRVRVIFRTPTDLKHDQHRVAEPEFGVLFARARDRVSTLRSLYGAGPLDIDFQAMGASASVVQMKRCHLQHVGARRRSSRTGQQHAVGGFVGEAEYEGDLSPFLPYLEAAQWTGVGRHCVWGNGELRLQPLDLI